MKMLAVVGLVLACGCSSVTVRGSDGKNYRCTPTDANQRGPFIPDAPAGTTMTVK